MKDILHADHGTNHFEGFAKNEFCKLTATDLILKEMFNDGSIAWSFNNHIYTNRVIFSKLIILSRMCGQCNGDWQGTWNLQAEFKSQQM